MELRMYGLVNYQLSGIQKGIQFGHAVVEYGQMVKGTELEEKYNDWADNWKTFIVLNGGTTSDELVDIEDRLQYHGSLNRYSEQLKEMDIPIAEFREPDLGNQLTAVVFIVSESAFGIPTQREFMREFQLYTTGGKSRDQQVLEMRQEKYGEENVAIKDFLTPLRFA